jgi:hypothetical protein
MSYREVSVIEIREMLRLWLQGRGLREVARLSGTDRKTARRYVEMAQSCGLDRAGGVEQLSDELLGIVIAGVRRKRPNGKSDAWETIATQRDQIKEWLDQGLTFDQDPYPARSPRCGGVVSDAEPLRDNGIRVRETAHHGAGGRLRTRR